MVKPSKRLVGKEGMGCSPIERSNSASGYCADSGDGLRMKADVFKAQVYGVATTYPAATLHANADGNLPNGCLATFTEKERCCRWLLMGPRESDPAQGSSLLGVRAASVKVRLPLLLQSRG